MYLSSATPRVLVVNRATGRPYYAAADLGLHLARDAVVRFCLENGGAEANCVLVMENFRLLVEQHAEAPATP
jgi:hypothetical protein